MRINSYDLKNKITALFLEFPELQEDEDLRLDTLEGETDFNDVMAIIVDDINSAAAMQDAIELRIKDLKARKERFEFRERGWRKLAQELMNHASLRKLMLAEATLSIRAGQPSVQITDQTFIPDKFWRIKREPNVSLIKETLKDGGEVPGAMLNNSPDTLAILRK